MTKFKISILILALTVMTSCEFAKDSFTFKDKTKAFVEALMVEDYDKCVSQMAVESDLGQNINIDTLKMGLDRFRDIIERNFGNEFEYSFMKSEKKRSTIASQNTPPNTTLAQIEFSNEKEFGVFQVLFDDKSKTIINIEILDVKYPKPNMLLFWLFGLLPLAVLLFNIYVIRKIKRSSLKKKWLKYLAVIILNVPAISYSAISGLSFKLLNFQILLGVSFSFTGYLGSVWTFGIPLGGLCCLLLIKLGKNNENIDIQNESLGINEQNIENKDNN